LVDSTNGFEFMAARNCSISAHLMQDGSCNTLQSILFVRKGSDKTEIPIQGSSKMSHQKPFRCIFVPIVILLLVLGMTFGMVWHHHADSSATTCPICHLVIVPLAAGIHVWWVPVPLGTVSEAIYMEPVARTVPRLPARAPPA